MKKVAVGGAGGGIMTAAAAAGGGGGAGAGGGGGAGPGAGPGGGGGGAAAAGGGGVGPGAAAAVAVAMVGNHSAAFASLKAMGIAGGGPVRVPVDVEIARQDALRACNPDIDRPFTSLEDACERLLPFHVLADYDADDVSDKFLDSTGRVLSRAQLWNESLTAKINEFKSILQKQIDTFNLMSKKRRDGEVRAEERLMIEQFLMQDEKKKFIDAKMELEARDRAEREADARMKEALVQAQAQAQAEAHARAEAARINMVHAEAARMQAHAEVARLQAHAEAVRQAQAGVSRLQAHPDASARLQAQAGAMRMQAEPSHFRPQGQEENTGAETGSQEQDGTVQDMLENWETLEEEASESNAEDLFNAEQVADMDLLASNTIQGEVGTLDLNSLTSR